MERKRVSRSHSRTPGTEPAGVDSGAVAADDLVEAFPPIDLPIRPPFPPMEAKSVAELPEGGDWLYEPKWDGFRCLAFRSEDQVLLQSKSAQPLGRYFPEVVEALSALPARSFVLDSEIVVAAGARLSFDDLLQRIHPAESRIRKLARETPANLLCFDLLVDGTGKLLTTSSLEERRRRLEAFFQALPGDGLVRISPATRELPLARQWMRELAASGLDGVVAKDLSMPYRSGDKNGMRKVKLLRTADCVVGGFRWTQKGGEVGSLLLGLYDQEGLLHHVGFSSSFTAAERNALEPILRPRVGPSGFTGNAPGGPSRWSTKRSTEWEPLRPELVCEVRYDHFSGHRFRHGTKFLRWRPDKPPSGCTLDQVAAESSRGALARLGLGPAGR